MSLSQTLFACFCSLAVVASFAVAAPPAAKPLSAELAAKKPVNLMPADPVAAMKFRDVTGSAPPATAVWSGRGDSAILRVEAFNRPKAADHVDVTYAVREPFKKGDVMLARFFVRAEYAKQESGEAAFEFTVMQRTPEFTRHVLLPLSAGPDWAMIEVPFAAARDADTTQAEIRLLFGTIPQAVEVAGLEVWNFAGRAKISEMPATRFTYRGREDDASWRKTALERIEKIRTAPIDVRVIDAAGKSVPNASVRVQLVRPKFIWGTSVDSSLIVADTDAAAKYRQTLVELFDTAVIENGMKWPKWSGSLKSRNEALAAADWIESQNLRMRGHCLVWPGDKFSPKRVQAMPAPRAELPSIIQNHIRDILTTNRGRMVGWDVINEMLHERDYFKTMPETEAAEWFKVARETDPSTKLFINEYAMLNSRKSPEKIADYVALVKRLQDAGAPIDGMGIQSHIGRQMRTPEDVLSDLDLLAAAGLELQATEFDINTPDEELQADYTRDFLIAFYSHPATTGFTKWGFWQGRHWKPDAAMFRADWSEKPSVKVWRDLVRKQWLTNVETDTDADGALSTRGHFGDYLFTVTIGDKTFQQMRTLTKDGAKLTIQIL